MILNYMRYLENFRNTIREQLSVGWSRLDQIRLDYMRYLQNFSNTIQPAFELDQIRVAQSSVDQIRLDSIRYLENFSNTIQPAFEVFAAGHSDVFDVEQNREVILQQRKKIAFLIFFICACVVRFPLKQGSNPTEVPQKNAKKNRICSTITVVYWYLNNSITRCTLAHFVD